MREEKRGEIIHDALNFLDDEMIEEVEELRENRKTKYSWRRWAGLAACLGVLIIAAGIWQGITGDGNGIFTQLDSAPSDGFTNVENESFPNKEENKEYAEDITDEDTVVDGSDALHPEYDNYAVTLPAYQVNLGQSDYAESDMALFFIYEGRCYVQTCDYMSKDVVGKYVCTTTGLIDEWTPKDGYVELAGSFEAEIYTVKGVDPEFMLCTVHEDGVVETFVHNNDISLNRGNEILDWLGFEVGMEEYVSFCNKGNSCTTEVSEEAREILDKFFAIFGENEVMLRKDISTTTNEEDIYHLVIVTEKGVPLHFEILNGGYVSYYGLNNVCVKIDERVYKLVIDVLEGR